MGGRIAALDGPPSFDGRRRSVALAAGLCVAVAARLVLAWTYYGDFDQDSYAIVAGIMERGGNVYAETERYNYAPVWAWLLLGLDRLALWADWPLHFAVRAFLTLVDVGDAALLGLLAARVGRSWRLAVTCYLLSPLSVLLTGLHGQFENLAALPILAAAVLAAGPRPTRLRWVWALLTASLLIKQILAFSVWTVLAHGRRLPMALSAGAFAVLVFCASFVPYAATGWPGILAHVAAYSGGFRWGLDFLLPTGLHEGLLFGVMLGLRQLAASLPVPRQLLLASLALVVLLPGFSTQQLLIPVLFGAVYGGRWFWSWSALGAVLVLLSEFPSLMPDLGGALLFAWPVAGAWLAWAVCSDTAPARSAGRLGLAARWTARTRTRAAQTVAAGG